MMESPTQLLSSPFPDQAAIDGFRATLRGDVVLPSDPDYEEARKLWNGMIDKRPGMIVRCTGVSDVISSVNFARNHKLLVAVRGGGHNVAGKGSCDGGMVIDLSRMKGVRVDPASQTGRAEPGVVWKEFDRETQAFGLATPGGVISSTGIAGFTLGGGLGWLVRKHGLTCDNLVSADVVTADGRFLTASHKENSDLFWGLRGGGGNFGIVTSFEYKLHPVGKVLGGFLFYPFEKTAEILRFYREFAKKMPEELLAFVTFATAPPEHFIPNHLHGKTVVAIAACYAGPVDKGEKALKPLGELGPPAANLVSEMNYCDLQQMFDADYVPKGFQNYWKSDYLSDINDKAIDTIIRYMREKTSPHTGVDIIYMGGGAFSRVKEDDTAFSHRNAPYFFDIESRWSNPEEDDRHIQWSRQFWEAMRPFTTGGVYVNFLMEEGDDRVRAAYGPAKYQKLVALKNKYDPTNFFQLNQNIKPTK